MAAESSALRRSTVAPKGTSASRRRGRWRLRTARPTTIAMRASPFRRAASRPSSALTCNAVDQALDGRQGDAALPERRQHVLDVAQEQGVRPDHEDALALEGEAVCVEKVCGPVQRHRRLARSRPSLDHHDTGERERMISSCSRWMVATMSRMAPVRAPSSAARRAPGPPSSRSAVPVVVRRCAVGAAVRPVGGWEPWPEGEALVLDADDPPPLVRRGAGAGPGPWARGPWPGRRARPRVPASRPPGARGPPRDPQPADVEALDPGPAPAPLAVLAPVDAAEAQGLLADVELVEPGEARPDDDVALLAELVRPARGPGRSPTG